MRPAHPSRRRLLERVLAFTAGTTLAPLVLAGQLPGCRRSGTTRGFGPLTARPARNATALRSTVVGDLGARPLLALPEGFSYEAFSLTGERLDDGGLVPAMHDGMACFDAGNGRLRLVRNHELLPGEARYGNRAGARPANGRLYDDFNLPPGAAGGGTTTLELDGDGRLMRHWASLGGTVRNCGGGPTPWGSWLSCEETVDTPASASVLQRRHGYVFEVPFTAEEGVMPVPIKGMGRFMHEAVVVDPSSGHCYLTEDTGDSCLYRYTPTGMPRREGDLQRGGSLHALVIDTDVVADCDGGRPRVFADGNVDTRRGVHNLLGQRLPVRWTPVAEPDPATDVLREQAWRGGAALFARGEGAWLRDGLVCFVCTSGGDAHRGQVWALDPVASTVTLLLEAERGSALQNPDNLTAGVDGTLYLMEDGPGGDGVFGLDREGGVFPFIRNVMRLPASGAADLSEFAGGCFSPDGRLFFVNSQGVGISFVISRDDGNRIALAD